MPPPPAARCCCAPAAGAPCCCCAAAASATKPSTAAAAQRIIVLMLFLPASPVAFAGQRIVTRALAACPQGEPRGPLSRRPADRSTLGSGYRLRSMGVSMTTAKDIIRFKGHTVHAVRPDDTVLA